MTFSNRFKCEEGRLIQSLGRTCRLFLSTKECHGAVIVRAPSTEELPGYREHPKDFICIKKAESVPVSTQMTARHVVE